MITQQTMSMPYLFDDSKSFNSLTTSQPMKRHRRKKTATTKKQSKNRSRSRPSSHMNSVCIASSEDLSFIQGGLNSDFQIVQRLLPLLEGDILYKKFSNKNSMNLIAQPFDPLYAEQNPPESCGYGIRHLQVDKALKQIIVKSSLRNTVEMAIPLQDVI